MEVREIDIDAIRVSPFNVRQDLDSGIEDANIDDLANSIKEHGLLNPVVVMADSDGIYDLVVGQRRYLACKKNGMTTISAIIRNDLDDTSATILSLIENVQRADMNPMDKTRAFVAILSKYGNPGIVARKTGVSVATVRKYAKLLKLAPTIQDKLTTAQGPTGVETLSILADTFAQEDQEWVLGKIRGFNQSVQQQILKASDGDRDKLPELIDQALGGAFNVVMCGEGLCFKMSDARKAQIRKELGEQQRLF